MIKKIRQTRCRSLLVSLAAVFAVSAAPVRAESDSAMAAAIDQAAQAAIAAGDTPGLQVAVYKNGAPVLVKAYGMANLELNVPMTNDSVVRIGSITKQFPAVALLLLQEEGKLSLDDKLAKYYPTFPRAADISLQQMLHHTSGLHSFTVDESFDKRDQMLRMTTDEWIDHFARMPKTQDFEPGTSWLYSNTAYYLLGAIVEKLEGKPLAAVLQERLFTPLGMTRTAMDDEYDIVPGRAAGYGADAQGKFISARFISMTSVGAAGAMRSTASDLIRWNSALFGGKVLKPASLQAMLTPGRLNDGRLSSTAIKNQHLEGGEYGYGLLIGKFEGHEWFGHGGGIEGFTSLLGEIPGKGITFAIIANSLGEGKGAFKVAGPIRRILVGAPEKKEQQ